ncbi:MAG: DinB family protein, partial [Bacteroidia bacterium]|nr:DinB family protein [Bacteroidia bacterium]MDW8158510.1 DinB family protein [Bacteroidia bacterium]
RYLLLYNFIFLRVLDYFIYLFGHLFWAEKTMAQNIEAIFEIEVSIRELAIHLVKAYEVWFSRYTSGTFGEQTFLPIQTYSTFVNRLEQAQNRWSQLLRNLSEDQLNASFYYWDFGNTLQERKLLQVLTHLPLHSAYHRGQIALLLRQNNIKVHPTDFVIYKPVI